MASGHSNGKLNIYKSDSGKLQTAILASDYAITGLRFKGDSQIMTVSADGKIKTWHSTSGKKLHFMEEKDNPLMCIDINQDCNKFAVAGHSKVVNLYDDETKSLIKSFKPAFNEIGHSNRIFSINFHRTDRNLMASGGWDNIVVFYDIRIPKIAGHVLGAHICGDSLDMKGHYVLTGSWRTKEQIKIFDLRKFELIEKIKWEYELDDHTSYIYAAQFSKSGDRNLFAVGGSNQNLWRLWDFDNDKERSNYAGIENYPGSVYSLDFSNTRSNIIAVGAGDGNIKLYDIEGKV